MSHVTCHVSCELHNDATVAPATAAPGHPRLGGLGRLPRGPGLAAGGQLLLPGVRAQAELAPSPGVLLGPGGNLAELQSQNEEDLLDQVLVQGIEYWIGLTDISQEGRRSLYDIY